MKAITGIVRNGQIVADQPIDWPEGCRVVIEPAAKEQTLGIREEDWPTTPEGIAQLLAYMDQIEPLEMTAEEEAEWLTARKDQKQWQKDNFEKWSNQIEEIFK